jgi:hypothetical protein
VLVNGTASLLFEEPVGRRGGAAVTVPVFVVVVAEAEDGVLLVVLDVMQEAELPHAALF